MVTKLPEILRHFHILELPFEITAEIFRQFLPIYLLRSLPGLRSPTLLLKCADSGETLQTFHRGCGAPSSFIWLRTFFRSNSICCRFG
jgi:hypothetical protein